MLVKLGEVWVDPTKVVMLEPSDMVSVITETRSSRTLGDIGEFAAIINNAIGQSFGGQDEENSGQA